tara:strand:+ start:136 stop:1092 length:957 start_codon:yes stop_codon:yes gene_type:complete
MASVMGEKVWVKKRRIRQNPPAMSEQQAIERLGLRNLSPTNKALVIKGKAPRGYRGSYENYVAEMQKAYLEKTEAAEKIQAAFRNPDQFRKKVRKMKKLNQLEKKALKLAQRRNLLQEEDRIRGQLNAMSPNSPSPPRGRMKALPKIRSYNNNPVYTKKMLELRARANPSPRSPRQARYYNKLKQLYTTGRAKKVAKKARVERIEKRRGKRKRPRQAQKPRKKKKPTLAPAARMKAFNKKMTSKLPKIRTTNSPTIAQIQRNLLAANSPTIAQIQRNLLKKRYRLTDLITGKIKTFTKKGWYDRAVAKQQILRMRICA